MVAKAIIFFGDCGALEIIPEKNGELPGLWLLPSPCSIIGAPKGLVQGFFKALFSIGGLPSRCHDVSNVLMRRTMPDFFGCLLLTLIRLGLEARSDFVGCPIDLFPRPRILKPVMKKKIKREIRREAKHLALELC